MKVDLGVYSKNNKDLPKVIGPRRRVDRKVLAQQMLNKKKKKGSKRFTKVLVVIFLLAIFSGIGAAIWKFNRFKSRVTWSGNGAGTEVCDNILNPKCWDDAFKPTFKQTDGFSNALLIGVDTRAVGDGSDLMNTDVIMVASVNHTTKKTMLLSIPRDMAVPVYKNNQYIGFMKINAIYATGGGKDGGIELLRYNIERLLGITIHYTGIVNFEAVKSAVDAVGGVDIDVKTDLVVQYPEETPPFNYTLYEFKKGLQTMDGKHALVYSRFRYVYSGDQTYASDFSRAARQQEVIDALKEKVLADQGGITELAQKYWQIYQSLSSNVTVDGVSFEDALAGFSLISDYDKNPINVVLDPNFMGLNQYVHRGQEEGMGYYIEAIDDSWTDIRNAIKLIWQYPEIYDDKPVVVLSNRTPGGFASDSKAIQLESAGAPFIGLFLITDDNTDTPGIVIYDFTNGAKQRTVDYLKQYFGTENVVSDPASVGVKATGYDEDIRVEFGPPEETPVPTTSETSE